jgi:outer membrane protein TolC
MRTLVSGLLWCLGLWPGALRAQALPHDSAPAREIQALSYDEALAWVDRAPDLKARNFAAAGLEDASARVSGLPADLTFTAEAGPRVTPQVAAQGRLAVSQSFALAGLGRARRDVLRGQASAIQAERALGRFERRVEVARAWLDLHYAQEAADVAQNELTLAEDLARVSARGAELLELTRADAADASAYAAEAKLNSLSAEGALADARFELTRALGIKDRILDARGAAPAFDLPSVARAAQLHAALANAPGLSALVLQIAALDARVREVQANHASQLGVGLIADRTDPRAFAALGTVSLTLPWEGRAVRERADLISAQAILRGRLAEAEARAHVELERLLHEIEHAQSVLDHAEQKLLPAIESGLSAREALFRSGEGNVLEMILARRSALALRVRHAHLRTDLLFALARFTELARALEVAK